MARSKNHRPTGQEENFFGFRPVDASHKEDLVKGVFNNVAENYDTMNDAMSLGVHRLWKRRFIQEAAPRSNEKMLDVAGGTGDIAFLARKKAPDLDVTVCDINEEMLRVGQRRAIDRGHMNEIGFVTGNAEHLPFPDHSFDIYTISFGLRNVTHIDKALSEAFRVLKPGGRMLVLEFSDVKVPLLNKIYDLYSFHIIPKLGKAIAKDEDSYQYLVESIRQFPDQKNLAERMRAAGFEKIRWTNLSGGIAAIHKGWKI